MRDALTDASARWAALSVADRSTWDTYGDAVTSTNRLGAKYHLTGRAHYCAWFLAYTGAWNGSPFNDQVPIVFNLPSPPLLVSYSASVDLTGECSLQVNYTIPDFWPPPGKWDTISLYFSPPLAATRNFWKQFWPTRRLLVVLITDNQPHLVGSIVGSGWDPAGGEALFAKLHFLRWDSRLSPWIYLRTITQPA